MNEDRTNLPNGDFEFIEEFKRGDKVTYVGEHSYFRGYFLNYIHKLPWGDLEGKYHAPSVSCNVQQEETETVFVKPIPTEKNRGWNDINKEV